MLRNISYREKVLLSITIFFLLTFVFYLKIYDPLRKNIRELNNQIEIVQNDIVRARISSRRLPQIQEELEIIEEELSYYRALIPTEEQVTLFLKDLEVLAKEFDLRFKVFRPKGNIAYEMYNQQEYTVNLIGRYDRAIGYITKLEEFQRIVNIKEMNMNNASNDGIDWVDLSITIVTYTLNPEEGGAI